jgi:hypothetical protein
MNSLANRTRPVLRLLGSLGVAASGLLAVPAHSAVVNVVPGNVAASTITFSAYDSVVAPVLIDPSADVGTAEVGEAVILTVDDPSAPRILGAVDTSLGSNGWWPASGAFAGLNAISGSMTFAFGRGMNFAGGLLNYDPESIDSSATLSALDKDGNVLENVVLGWSFGAPDAVGLGTYVGFHRGTADIWGLMLTNAEVVIDNLGFGTNRVPEPGSAALLLLAMAGLAAVRKRPGAAAR